MLDVAAAQARIFAAFAPLPGEVVPLQQAGGRVLVEPVVAERDQPPAAVSAMDGYAVRALDAEPGRWLDVVGTIAAGRPPSVIVGAGQAARIFTGGLVPDGADAILIQEDALVEGGRIQAKEAVRPGLFVRPQGLDYRAGWVGLEPGTVMSPLAIGLAASLGAASLAVRRQPRVGIIATGDELRLPGGRLAAHELASSNSFTLAAMLAAWGAVPVDLGIALDTPDDLARKLDAARGLDLLVTTGGASVGDHDLVRRVSGEAGLALDFWKIRMRPGKPLIFGRLGETPLLGLPGNPVSAAVCGIVFVRGAVRCLLGLDPALPVATARLARDIPAGIERQDYQRARLVGQGLVEPAERQDSSMLATLATADVLLVRPPSAPALSAGAEVPVIDLATVLRS
jgi:molybdopterin molybdotransferase